MDNTELDKTIEELEAEVLVELEEDNGDDAPKKGAMLFLELKKARQYQMVKLKRKRVEAKGDVR